MSELHHLRDGAVVLYLRDRSPHWQARIKSPENTWVRISTKTNDVEEAGRIAAKEYDMMHLRKQAGLQGDNRRKFGAAIDAYVAKLQEEIDAGTGKPIYASYIGICKNWITPNLGNKPIAEVDDAAIEQFESDRKKKLGADPAKTTINQHNVVLRAIFDTAAKKKWINRTQIPELTVKNKGKKTERRPDFSLSEWQQLYRFMRKWVKLHSKNSITRYKRQLLREYVLILANTGMRPGTEQEELRWKDVEVIKTASGKDAIRIWVNRGKTDERQIIARATCERYFKRLRALTRRTDPEDLIFVMQDGEPAKWFSEMFTNMLIDADLLYHPQSGKRRTLYSLRHMFATFRIVYKHISFEVLAKQMGTSVTMIEQHYSHLTPTLAADVLLA